MIYILQKSSLLECFSELDDQSECLPGKGNDMCRKIVKEE